MRLDRRVELTRRWGQVEALQRGRLDVAGAGTVAYQATPVQVGGQTVGVFVAAWFRDLETAEIDEVVLAAAALGGLVVLFAAGTIWYVTGRVLRPVDEVAATARSISESDLSLRPGGARRDRAARVHVQRHARPAPGRLPRPAGVRRRCRA